MKQVYDKYFPTATLRIAGNSVMHNKKPCFHAFIQIVLDIVLIYIDECIINGHRLYGNK